MTKLRSNDSPLATFLKERRAELNQQYGEASTLIGDHLVGFLWKFFEEAEESSLDKEEAEETETSLDKALREYVPDTKAKNTEPGHSPNSSDAAAKKNETVGMTREQLIDEVAKIAEHMRSEDTLSFVTMRDTSEVGSGLDVKWGDVRSVLENTWNVPNRVLMIVGSGISVKIEIPPTERSIVDAKIKTGMRDIASWKQSVENELKARAGSKLDHLVDGLVQPTGDLVDIFPDDEMKAKLTVVSGESGTGKSIYATKYLEPDTPLVHITIDEHKIRRFQAKQKKNNKDVPEDNDPDEQEKIFDEYSKAPAWRDVICLLMKILLPKSMDENKIVTNDFYNSLSMASKQLMANRNKRAMEFASYLIDDHMSSFVSTDVTQWWTHGNYPVPQLDKLVIVFDEASKVMPFVNGITAMGRDFARNIQSTSKVKRVALVLCGADLDVVQELDSGDRFVGTDPSLSQVLVMGSPDLNEIRETGDSNWPVRAAITDGIYSRILATNARMLGDGVRKALMSDLVIKHEAYGSCKSRKDRQTVFGSHLESMEYAVREYQVLNGVANLPTQQDRIVLFEKSFRYMHHKALESIVVGIDTDHRDASEMLVDRYSIPVPTDDIMFRIGVTRINPEKTTAALKFVACAGHARATFAADGESFEGTVAGHFYRMFQCWGYDVSEYTLQAGWPLPTNHKVDDDEVKKQDVDIEKIVHHLQADSKDSAVVLRQSCKNAQGADVLVIEWRTDHDGSRCLVVWVLQAKNWSEPLTPSSALVAARSVGIGPDGKVASREIDAEMPEDRLKKYESARHSECALKKLKEDLSNELGLETLPEVKRIVVMSHPCVNVQINPDWEFVVWGSEYLQPTMSLWTYTRNEKAVVPVGDDDDEVTNDDDDDDDDDYDDDDDRNDDGGMAKKFGAMTIKKNKDDDDN